MTRITPLERLNPCSSPVRSRRRTGTRRRRAVWQPSASATARVSPPTLDISRRRTTTRDSAARLGSADRSDSGSCSAQAPGGTAHARRTRDGSRTNLVACSGGGCGCRSSLRGSRDPYRMNSQRRSNALSPGCRAARAEQSRSETQANSSSHRPVWGSQPMPAGQVPPGPQRKPSSDRTAVREIGDAPVLLTHCTVRADAVV